MMKRKNIPDSNQSESKIQRQKAEELLKMKRINPSYHQPVSLVDTDTLKLIHELEVHQIELEMQNKELRLACTRAEAATGKYSELYDFAPAGYFTLTRESKIVELNLSGSKMLGKVRSLLINNLFDRFISRDTKPGFNLFLAKAFSSNLKETCEIILLSGGASTMPVHLTGILSGNGEHCLITAVDMTGSKQLVLYQEALERLQKIASRVPGVVYQYRLRPDGSSCFPFASEAIKEIYRVSPDEVREDASKVFANLHPDDTPGVVASILASAKDLTPWKYEYRVKFSDGTIRFLYGNAVPQREDDGSVLWHGFITDITERKENEEELKRVSTRLELAARASGIGVWDYDIVKDNLVWDDQIFALYGLERKDFISLNEAWQAVVHADDKERVYGEFSKAINSLTDLNTEFRVYWPDGSLHHLRALGLIQHDGSGKPMRIVGTNWDITDLRIAEKEKLDDSENRYRSIFQGSPDGIVITDQETKKIMFANPAQCEMLGYTEQELKTMTIAGIHPTETFQDLLTEFEKQVRGEANLPENIQVLKKNGETFYADIKPGFIVIDGRKCNVGFFRDVTRRRLADIELKDALIKAQASDRLKTAFLQNISHEVRTPLNGILGFGSLLADPHLTLEEKQRFNQFLKSSSDRLLSTITDYIDTSLIVTENVEVVRKPVRIGKLMNELQTRFENLCNAGNLTLNLLIPKDQGDFILTTDPVLLQKIISCLIDNAIKFTPHGSVTMGYSVKTAIVEFFVIDTGIGIASEAHERIFEPFMHEIIANTRRYEGSGLGLTITRGFLNLLGGKIRLESEKGKGSAFFFSLPIEEEITLNDEPLAMPVLHAKIDRPVILIAEDDLFSDFYMGSILESMASVVYKVANGKDAVEMCRLHPEISIVLMDMKMPVMDGMEAARQIRTFRTDLLIIAVTAYAMSKDKKKAIDAGCNDFLSKPVSRDELLAKFKKYGLIE